MDYEKVLEHLINIINAKSDDNYTVVPYAFGFILFKNNVNMVGEVSDNFYKISHYLLNEIENINN